MEAKKNENGDREISVTDLIALNLGELASALEARNEIDKCLYKKMEERDKRMEEMMREQQRAYHRLIWALVLTIGILAGVNVVQFVGIVP